MAATLTGYLMAAQEDRNSCTRSAPARSASLMAVGDLVIGWLLLRQAEITTALDNGVEGADKAFYEGKGRRRDVLREEHAAAAHVDPGHPENIDNDIMEPDEAAF